MTKLFTYTASAAIAATGMAIPAANGAADPSYQGGDLIAGFQALGGSATIQINLGAAGIYRNATGDILNIANIGPQLGTLFNAGVTPWYERTDMYFGVSGARSNLTFAGTLDANGDPNSTPYATRARLAEGTIGQANSTAWGTPISLTGGSLSGAAGNMVSQGTTFDNNDASGIAQIPAGTSNSWDTFNPINSVGQQTAYGAFAGGIQYRFGAGTFGDGSFGGVNLVEGAADLYRVPRFNTGGGTSGMGEFEGTFVVDQGGNVSYLVAVPEPSSAILLATAVAALGTFTRRRRSSLSL